MHARFTDLRRKLRVNRKAIEEPVDLLDLDLYSSNGWLDAPALILVMISGSTAVQLQIEKSTAVDLDHDMLPGYRGRILP